MFKVYSFACPDWLKLWPFEGLYKVSLSALIFKSNMPGTIIVTGGSGLVGSGIRLALENEEYHLKRDNEKWIFLSSKDVNLENASETLSFFEKTKPTHVIHLAAKVGGLFANMSDNLEFFVSFFIALFK